MKAHALALCGILGIPGCVRPKPAREIIVSGVVGQLDIREIPDVPSLRTAAKSVAAVLRSDIVKNGRIKSRNFAQEVSAQCEAECNQVDFERTDRLKRLAKKFGNLESAAHCAGVLLYSNVVVATRHCFDNLGGDPGEIKIAFGFDSTTMATPEVLDVKRVCVIGTSSSAPLSAAEDFAIFELKSDSKLGQTAKVGSDLQARRYAMAIGHPLGLSRLLSGANEETKIERCESEMGEDFLVFASLDTFQRSSGSAVYISEYPRDRGPWSLFGLVHTTRGRDLQCFGETEKICGPGAPISVPSNTCDAKAVITPLSPAVSPAKLVHEGKVPRGWWCVDSSS